MQPVGGRTGWIFPATLPRTAWGISLTGMPCWLEPRSCLQRHSDLLLGAVCQEKLSSRLSPVWTSPTLNGFQPRPPRLPGELAVSSLQEDEHGAGKASVPHVLPGGFQELWGRLGRGLSWGHTVPGELESPDLTLRDPEVPSCGVQSPQTLRQNVSRDSFSGTAVRLNLLKHGYLLTPGRQAHTRVSGPRN